MSARKKAPPVNSAEVERKTFVMTKGAGVYELLNGKKQNITEKQLAESIAWCVEGGRWIPKGERNAPIPRIIDWRCEHHFCLGRIKNPGKCRWFVDSAFRVWCGELHSERPNAPAIYRGSWEDRPMVLESCRTIAYSPLVTQRDYEDEFNRQREKS